MESKDPHTQTNRPPAGPPPIGRHGPGPGPGTDEKARNLKKAIKRLFNEIGHYHKPMAVAFILVGTAAILAVLRPSFLSDMVNLIEVGLTDTMPLDEIIDVGIILLILRIAGSLLSYIQNIIVAHVSNRFTEDLRNRISQKINRLPLRYFDRTQSGDILSRVSNDTDTIAQTLNNALSLFFSSTVLLIGVTIMMFVTNFNMALTAIITSLIGFSGMTLIIRRSQKYFSMRQRELGKLGGHVEEAYTGMNIIKIYNAADDVGASFDRYNQGVFEANRKSQFLSGLMQPLMMFVGNFGYVAVCVVGALLTMNNVIGFGVIVAFILYVRLFTNQLSDIAQTSAQLQSAAAASERVFEFLDTRELEPEDHAGLQKLLPKNVRGEVEFDHVNFRYDPSGHMIIRDFSAVAEPGQKIAIVGPTGAGKTTLVNLLMKFYDVESGDIRIDGISIKDMSRANVRSLFTMVLQDVWLFAGTVKENIVYANKDVKMADVERVCREIGLDHFINGLPGGYNARLGENVSISAGQKQLLTIARGMLQNTPFLILDEATSNVDTRTEILVKNAMDKLAEGRTSFIIAHRLSTIRNADLILVMNHGNIVEQGNHDELMALDGFYAKLYNSQFELDNEPQ